MAYQCPKCGGAFRLTNLDDLTIGECVSCGCFWPIYPSAVDTWRKMNTAQPQNAVDRAMPDESRAEAETPGN